VSQLVGTAHLLRTAVRRDRIVLPIVVLLPPLLAWSSAVATIDLYPTEESRVSAAEVVNSSGGLVALYGTIEPSIGALASFKLQGVAAVYLSIIVMFLVRRHTRTDEETDRLELLAGGVMGRFAPLTAALALSFAAVCATAVLTAAGMAAAGLPVAGSIALGAAWLVAGLTFAAISAVGMQLSQSARTCAAIVGGVIALAYVMRAVGDVVGEGPARALTWLSPYGWVMQIKPYAGDHWWVVLVGLAFTAVATGAAYALRARRDLGAGLVPDRPGPEHTRMGSPLALAWRLQRGAVLGWSLAILAGGLLVGGLAANITDLLDTPQARDMIRSLGGEGALSNAFLAAEFAILAIVVTGFGIAGTLRLQSEETSTRSELALSTATTRQSWLMSHVTLALLGTAWVMVLLGLGSSIAHAANTGDLGEALRTVMPAALVQIPAIWVLVGLTVALYGTSSRLSLLAWVALVACLLVGQFADLLKIPAGLSDLSPVTHVPLLPGGNWSATPLGLMTLLAVVLLAVGSVGFRRRDIG
jgi:ABC-2 type transport system permease protein